VEGLRPAFPSGEAGIFSLGDDGSAYAEVQGSDPSAPPRETVPENGDSYRFSRRGTAAWESCLSPIFLSPIFALTQRG
jgi:hypothetical protein